MAERPHSFSFVHAADLHLDTPFSGVHAVAPQVATALRDASLAALDAIVDLAISRSAAFVLFAGDVYDGAERGLRAQLRFRDNLARLSRSGIASFVVHGNHDPVESGWSALGEGWPEGVTVFRPHEVTVVPVMHDGAQIATVQGISYARRDTAENLARLLTRPDGDGVHIGLLHCNVEGAPGGHANYAPCTLDDLRATRLDYLALGHVHERRILAGPGAGDPWVVYPGNSQARSPRASERGAKGAVVVEVRDSVVLEPEFVACDQVRFAEVAVDVAEFSEFGGLASELAALAEEARAAADGRSVVLRGVLGGRGGLHRDLARPGLLDELLRHLRDGSGALNPFVWWDAIVDESAAETEVEAGRGDFADDLLAIAAALEDEHLAAALAALAGEAPRPLRRPIDELLATREQRESLLAAASRLALSELGGSR
ncbi:MAG TPA: DNA repair exonuclease [Acidimicrobiales bacterium]|nr:DNA repair exonuclease [Acidimicrobiales bacterium]